MYIFLDEAGNLTDDKDDHFVLTGIFTLNPRPLRKLIRRTRKAKLSSRNRRKNSEIKASKATDKYKKYLYEHLMKINNFEVFALYLKVSDIPLHMKGKEGIIYLRMTEELLKLGLVEKYNNVNLIMDHRSLKGITQNAFDTAIYEEFAASFKCPKLFNVYHVDSQKDKGIQICDFVTHAIYQKYQRQNADWYKMIENKITKIEDAKSLL